MISNGFNHHFEESKFLSDFLPAYKNRTECYQSYRIFLTNKFHGIGNTCEFCNQQTSTEKTFSAAWKFEYVDDSPSLLPIILGSALMGFLTVPIKRFHFVTLHVACPACFSRVRFLQATSKTLKGILSTLLIISLLGLVGTVMFLFFEPTMLSANTILAILCLLIFSTTVAFSLHKSEKLVLVGTLSKIAKSPIVLESLKFHSNISR